MIKVVVLDRDGVINIDSIAYIKSPDEWVAIPGSLDAIARLTKGGFKVVVATNQSGLARGYFTAEILSQIHAKMCKQVEEVGGKIDAIFVCPHGPQDNCGCRKPKPGLFMEIAKHYDVNNKEMLVVGDSMRDLIAAKSFDVKSILVKTGNGEETSKQDVNVPVVDDLAAAVDLIYSRG